MDDEVTPLQSPVWVDGVTPLNSVNMTQLQTRDEKNAPSGYVGLNATSQIVLGGDTNLYRSSANILATDDTFRIFRPAVTDEALSTQIGGSLYFSVRQDGYLSWVGDTNLYRRAAAALQTNSDLYVDKAVVVDTAGGGNKLYFGSLADTNLYRAGAGYLATDNHFQATGLIVAAAGPNQITLHTSGAIYFGSAFDTSLYRAAAGQLKTDGGFYAVGKVGFHWNGAGWAVETAANGLVFQADTNLYRSAAGTLKTDGAFQTGAGGNVSPGGHLIIDPNLGGYKILFSNAADTNLYRSAAGTLKTDGAVHIGQAMLVGAGGADPATSRIYFGNAFDISVYRESAGTLRVSGQLSTTTFYCGALVGGEPVGYSNVFVAFSGVTGDKRVAVDVPDSAGAGYRNVRVPN